MPDTDPGSLDRLHDIVVPPPVGWWPLAPGWWVVVATGLVLLTVGVVKIVFRWQRDRYRRQALQELAHLSPTVEQLATVAELVKRVALAAYPRERVASLIGRPWLTFLDETGGNGAFATGPGQYLELATFGRPPALSNSQVTELWTAVRHWIAHHRC